MYDHETMTRLTNFAELTVRVSVFVFEIIATLGLTLKRLYKEKRMLDLSGVLFMKCLSKNPHLTTSYYLSIVCHFKTAF